MASLFHPTLVPASILDPHRANQMRWNGALGHYEVWYATLNHQASQTGFWIRYTIEVPRAGHGDAYAQLWFARFDGRTPERTFGINRKFPISHWRAENNPFSIQLDGAHLTNQAMLGELAGDGHQASWDFSWQPNQTTHLHLPQLAYLGKFAETVVLAPHLNSRASGNIVVDGEKYVLEAAPLGQTHLWGRKHAYAWAWSHTSSFEQNQDAVLETLSVQLRRRGIVLPTLTMFSLYPSQDPDEAIHFREFWQMPGVRSSFGSGHYELRAHSPSLRVEIALSCSPRSAVRAEYIDPDGEPAFAHNSEVGDATVKIWRRSLFSSRWREWKTLHAEKTAHFEWCGRTPDPAVPHIHQTVG